MADYIMLFVLAYWSLVMNEVTYLQDQLFEHALFLLYFFGHLFLLFFLCGKEILH